MIEKYIKHKFFKVQYNFKLYLIENCKCFNCGISLGELYNSLKESHKLLFNDYDYAINQEKCINEFDYIKKCLTEKEYLIKNIIE